MSLFYCHRSPSVPGPRYTQDFDSVDKRCVCAAAAAEQGFCPELNSAAAVVRAAAADGGKKQREGGTEGRDRGRESKRQGRVKICLKEKKSDTEGGHDK